MNQQIQSADAFVALITSEFMKVRAEKMPECQEAIKVNKPMYAIVKKGTEWGEFEQLPWRKVFFFSNTSRIFAIIDEIREDLALYRTVKKL